MIKNPRRLIVRWESVVERLMPTWPETTNHYAVLECGHRCRIHGDGYNPKRMACEDCGIAERMAEREKRESAATTST